uniref:Protein TIC 214 n=1 Tax=Lathyrus oleraceus subsp. biflorus TaxID=47742 RepID=A0A385JEA8_PEA|nr:hypothetical chloroplast RF19 [Pisum sativum subsp. elatius]QTC07690.1 hypothetical chloroplast RF19 [Pisum sativum subsp. elatius]
MICKYFVRDSFRGFCLQILNSAVVIGLYYGFLTTIAIGPSYVLLIRARVMEKEGSETEIAATTGFITGRLMIFISIYYTPLHLALNRPHTVSFLLVPYLFFYFLYHNDNHFYRSAWVSDLSSGYKDPVLVDSGYKNPNSIRNLRIYKVFFNNLLFQLFYPVVVPSSIVLRVMNIYLFRSNNKLFFLISSFVGWLIGHIFLMKCIGLVLVGLKQKNSIKSKITMRFDKYTLLQLRNYTAQMFGAFAFFFFALYLGNSPSPYYYGAEMGDYDENREEEIQAAIDPDETNQEDITVYLSQNEKKETTSNNINIDKNKKLAPLEKSLVTTLFDYNRWSRPLRYIENHKFNRIEKDENSQFFFQTCESDGKKRISFTYPPHLSTFQKLLEKKMDLFRSDSDKTSYNDNELFNYWSSINKEKLNQLSNELFQKAKIIDRKDKKKINPADVFDIRRRLSDDKQKRKYLPKIYDPFVNGGFRAEIQNNVSLRPFITNETDTTNSILVNKIHGLLISNNSNSPEFDQKIDQFDRKLLLTKIGFFVKLISKFSEKSVSSLDFDALHLFPEHEQGKMYSEEKKKKRNFFFDAIRTTHTNDTIFTTSLSSEINEISKEVPRWEYQLIDDIEVGLNPAIHTKDPQICCRLPDEQIVFSCETLFSKTDQAYNRDFSRKHPSIDPSTDFRIPHFLREMDFDREIIRGSVHGQRRKIAILKLFQANVHSPIFVDNYPFGGLFDDIVQYVKEYFRKPGTDNSEFLQFQKVQEERRKEDQKDEIENRLEKIEEAWESILYGLVIRNFVILFQSIFRKYILLPSLIITKNIIRILLFQNPEWSEDFRDWRKEIHVKCTYQGVPTGSNALPIDWFWGGLQIRVLHPFVLKPWHNKPKVRSTEKKKRYTPKSVLETTAFEKNFLFLTGYGTLVEAYTDEHVPNPFAFLGPIFNQITKQLKKDLKKSFRKFDNQKERKNRSPIPGEELKQIENELSEIQKNSPINPMIEESPDIIQSINPMIEESPDIIQSINWTNSEKRIKDLNVKTKTILKQIEKMTEEKNEGVITDAKRLELKKNRFQILQRRNVRLIRKSYCFFQIFMERLYIHILTTNYVEGFLTSSIVQRYLNYIKFIRYLFELTNKIVKKSIYNYNKKKNEQKVYKINQSIIPFMSTIEKPWNMNSENSCDVSSLSQAYVLFKLSQSQVSNGYKLRSIFESHGRSFFMNNEIKEYLLRIQGGRLNSKLRDKNRPDSIMNQWTNWLKVHYQYALPQRAWSRLVPQKWRNRIHEQRVAQNKDLDEYGSSQKTLLIFSKKEQVDFVELENGAEVDLVKMKKKIKKQYGYDLFSYQYINYVDKKKSYIYGYKSQSYNTPKNIKELFDIMGDSFIQNYIGKDGIDMEKNMDRKYFHWMGKRKKNSITNQKVLTPRFGFFSKVSAYKKNPWILPLDFFFMPFYTNSNITDKTQLELEKKEYEITENLNLYLAKYYTIRPPRSHRRRRGSKIITERSTLVKERDYLIKKYLGYYGDCGRGIKEDMFQHFNIQGYLLELKKLKKFTIVAIKKGDINIENLVRITNTDFCYGNARDITELRDYLMFFIEPNRVSIKNYEQIFIYQIISIALKHKRKISKRNSKNSRLENYDFLIPENLLSPRRRRELRILISLNSRNRKTVDRNTIKEKKINNSSEVLTKNKDLDSDTKKLKNLKFFLWPNYRFEDLACMNRYWFDTHNGSRFSILRIHMYPRLKI